jgi:hypothetical protein
VATRDSHLGSVAAPERRSTTLIDPAGSVRSPAGSSRRFALVRREREGTVGRRRHLVGQRSNLDVAEQFERVRRVKCQSTRGPCLLVFDGDADGPTADIDAVRAAAVRDVGGRVENRVLRRGRRVRNVEHLDLTGPGVDDEEPVGPRVVCDDLGAAVELARPVPSDPVRSADRRSHLQPSGRPHPRRACDAEDAGQFEHRPPRESVSVRRKREPPDVRK